MDNLDLFIQLNHIDKESLLEALHLDIRECLLGEICKCMKADRELLLNVKKIYFSNADIVATRKVVKKLCGCELSDEDILWMNKCIKAFLDKKDIRNPISDETKSYHLVKQNNRCAICGTTIDSSNAHIDHKIPWDFVGDELENNYQALCSDCNLHKSNHVAIAVTNLVLHKEVLR